MTSQFHRILAVCRVLAILPFALLAFAPPSSAQSANVSFALIPDDPNAVLTGAIGGSLYTQAEGVNDSGTLVGVYSSADDNFHAFQDSHGKFKDIDFPTQFPCSSGCGSEATSINDLGWGRGRFR